MTSEEGAGCLGIQLHSVGNILFQPTGQRLDERVDGFAEQETRSPRHWIKGHLSPVRPDHFPDYTGKASRLEARPARQWGPPYRADGGGADNRAHRCYRIRSPIEPHHNDIGSANTDYDNLFLKDSVHIYLKRCFTQ